ncbi:MAG: hypothetical protein AB1861_00710, partial [Cyanobacteriota bacterium]
EWLNRCSSRKLSKVRSLNDSQCIQLKRTRPSQLHLSNSKPHHSSSTLQSPASLQQARTFQLETSHFEPEPFHLKRDVSYFKPEQSHFKLQHSLFKQENYCLIQGSSFLKQEHCCLTQESSFLKQEHCCLTQESSPLKQENCCFSQQFYKILRFRL